MHLGTGGHLTLGERSTVRHADPHTECHTFARCVVAPSRCAADGEAGAPTSLWPARCRPRPWCAAERDPTHASCTSPGSRHPHRRRSEPGRSGRRLRRHRSRCPVRPPDELVPQDDYKKTDDYKKADDKKADDKSWGKDKKTDGDHGWTGTKDKDSDSKDPSSKDKDRRPHGGVHTGGGFAALNSGSAATGAALLAGGVGVGALALRRRKPAER